ncbi:MAG: DNA polymerase III subunit gamma/tau [Candidatus Lindowbacteria bacterium]|nr:DNA polymerase III subunit gamma/tau [Candidatus Lindowbacteria bacterium]
MTYEGLARRYRPQTFTDVVGQKHIVRTLSQAITENKWASAYLFIGGRGLGKTSMARLLAKGINCEKGPTPTPCGKCTQCTEIATGRDIDVLEIDAASNTGVDNVREVIINAVCTAPVRGHSKIFIIDEVHMLSNSAFNALLKTLEEPPPNVLFIMATTEGHRIPSTIRSRCQRFDFRPISEEELSLRIQKIAKNEKIKIDADALKMICDYAEGGVRDALSALDLISAYSSEKIDGPLVEKALGMVPGVQIEEMIDLIHNRESEKIFVKLKKLFESGIDAYEIARGLLNAFRRELHASYLQGSERFSKGRIVQSLESIIQTLDRARYARHPQLEMEILVTRLANLSEEEHSLKQIYQMIMSEDKAAPASAPRNEVVSATPSEFAKTRMQSKASVNDSAVEKPDSEPSTGNSSIDNRMSEFMKMARDVSSIAGALLSEADLKITSENDFVFTFEHTFHMNRFKKEDKIQNEIIKLFSEKSGEPVNLVIRTLDQSVETRIQPDSSAKKNSPDSAVQKETKKTASIPDLEKIKEIFHAEVVEIIEE